MLLCPLEPTDRHGLHISTFPLCVFQIVSGFCSLTHNIWIKMLTYFFNYCFRFFVWNNTNRRIFFLISIILTVLMVLLMLLLMILLLDNGALERLHHVRHLRFNGGGTLRWLISILRPSIFHDNIFIPFTKLLSPKASFIHHFERHIKLMLH